MNCKIFYSWQSDLPNRTNRGFIQNALEKAIKSLHKDDSINVEPVLDRDTQGVSGSPDIAATIFEKIEQSQIFVCDVSIINQDKQPRPTPNPNVLVELGYAMKTLGEEKMIVVMNTAFGKVEELPFDLRMRRVTTYSMPEKNQKPPEERNKLATTLTGAIGTILKALEEETPQETVVSIGEKAREAVENFLPTQKRLVRQFMERLTDEIDKLNPDFSSVSQNEVKDLLLEAIGQTEELVVEFAFVSKVIAETENHDAANALYEAFESILQNYNLPSNFYGTYRKYDLDFYRFMGYELFTIFFSFLIRENCWELIAKLLKIEFDIENLYSYQKEASSMPFTYVSYRAPVLLTDSYREYADVLNERHTGEGKLAEIVSMEQFMDADCFLFLRALGQKESDIDLEWYARSLFYMERPPRYLSKAKSAEFAKQLFPPLNVTTIEQFRSLINCAKQKLVKMLGIEFYEFGYQRLQNFNPQEIGSK